MTPFRRVGRNRPDGGEFAPFDRPESEVRLTRAERERQGLSPEDTLTNTVLDRCPDAVSWSVPVTTTTNGFVASGPITVTFPTGDTIDFDQIPGDTDDDFITTAIAELAIDDGEHRVVIVDTLVGV